MKKLFSSLRQTLAILLVSALFIVSLGSSTFAEGKYQETAVAESSETSSENTVANQDSNAAINDTNIASSENDNSTSESALPSPQDTSQKDSTGLLDEQETKPEYTPQPTSLDEVQLIIDEYSNAYKEATDTPPSKPYWEFEVALEFMPDGYFCELIEDDADFGAPYYTFFAGVATAAVGDWTGLGTSASPYVITDIAGLQRLAQNVNNGNNYSSVYFLLGNSINLNATSWTPIGIIGNNQELFYDHTNSYLSINTSKAFKGIFDGGGHTVSNFSVGSSSMKTGYEADYKGFFGIIENATIRNLILKNATLNGGSALGVLAGYTNGNTTIENCQVLDSFVTASGGANLAAGGMIGMINLAAGSSITISQANVGGTAVNSTAEYGRVGGMIGNIRSYSSAKNDSMNTKVLIEKNFVSGGNVTAQYYYVGGLLGEIDFYNSGGNTVTINSSQTNVTVSTTSDRGYYVGGFIGFTYIQGTSPSNIILVENCSALGNINAASYYIGGFIGYSENTSSASTTARPMQTIVRGSYATGNVSTSYTEASNVGGFIGHAHAGDFLPAGTMLVENCYSTGNVWGGGYNVGGFIARPTKNVRIANSYSTGDVFGQRNHIGGFVGYSEGTETSGNVLIENSFSTGNVVGNGYFVGGFIGWLQASQVLNSYSVGSVHSGGASTGGFIGQISYISKVTNSYSAGHVSSTSSTGIGGFIGKTASEKITITNCYFDGTTSQQFNAIGQAGGQTASTITRFNTRDMTTLSKFNASWKMLENRFGAATGKGTTASPWYIDNGITYPYLHYQYDGQSTANSNYNLGSVQYSSDSGQSFKPFGQFLTDFSFASSSVLRFKVDTAGASRVFFPFIHGTSTSNYNSFRFLFAGKSQQVPSSGNFTFTSGTPYSLGSISKSGIVAFSSSPYAEKASNRPVYVPANTNTYTYVGDRVIYSVSVYNYSREFDWRNIVFTDTLAKGLSLVSGSVELNDTAITTSGVPSYSYDTESRTLSVNLPDMPKNDAGSPQAAIITFKVDVGTDAASIFPLNPTDDNIRNRGGVSGDLFQASTFIQSLTVAVDDENTDPVFPKYKVTYDGNSGTLPSSETQVADGYYLPGSSYTVKGNDTFPFSRTGYYFAIWNSKADGSGTTFAAGDNFSLDKDTTLYAIWNENPSISFFKVDGIKSQSGDYQGLPGATFALYRWDGAPTANLPDLELGGNNWHLERNFTTSSTPGQEGLADVQNLTIDTSYLMIETTAPTGYELPNAQWLIYISSSGEITIGDMLSGKPAFAIQEMGKVYMIANYTLSQAYELPDAGGGGPIPLMILGVALIITALSATYTFRKHTARKKRYAGKAARNKQS